MTGASRKLNLFFSLIPELDTENAVGAIGGSEMLYEKVLRQIIRWIPDNIQIMDNSLVADGNLLSFATTSHGLKSSFRQIGHRKLACLAGVLEPDAKAGDMPSCLERYGEFKNEILRFYDQAKPLLHDGIDKDMDTGAGENNIIVFKDAFEHAKAAAEEYDTLAAVEILSPFSNYRFGAQADEAMSQALDALEAFRPLAALAHIEKLIGMCGNPLPQPDKEYTNV